jgi:hypothetical protein
MKLTFEELIEQHGLWADATFPKGTAEGALIHAGRELIEVQAEVLRGGVTFSMAVEYADLLFCILDSARRQGLTLNEIINAGEHKLNINKARKWKDNGDGSYSHIKD